MRVREEGAESADPWLPKIGANVRTWGQLQLTEARDEERLKSGIGPTSVACRL